MALNRASSIKLCRAWGGLKTLKITVTESKNNLITTYGRSNLKLLQKIFLFEICLCSKMSL